MCQPARECGAVNLKGGVMRTQCENRCVPVARDCNVPGYCPALERGRAARDIYENLPDNPAVRFSRAPLSPSGCIPVREAEPSVRFIESRYLDPSAAHRFSAGRFVQGLTRRVPARLMLLAAGPRVAAVAFSRNRVFQACRYGPVASGVGVHAFAINLRRTHHAHYHPPQFLPNPVDREVTPPWSLS